jgi:methionyl-tRNA formyltransferase
LLKFDEKVKQMKVVYFGSDVFLSCFEYFLQEHEILALYTYHNAEDYFMEYSIVNKAKQMGIPVYYESISPERITRYFREEGCELFFAAEYNRILKIPENLPEFRGINTHSSMLPQGRGYYPIEAAMERGLARSGVTMHKLAPKVDQGDILDQRSVEITDEMDSIDIYLHCAEHAREMLETIVGHLDRYWESAHPQSEIQPYWLRPDTALLTLEHEMTREEALSVFRNYNSMTQVWLDGEWYHVTALSVGTGPLIDETLFLSPVRLLYRVKDGHLRLHIHPMEVQK